MRARTSSDQLFGGLADRYLDIARNSKYDYARVQLAKSALVPSRVLDDSAAWTAMSGSARMLETFGSRVDDKYVLASRRGVGAPVKPADGRHLTTLSRLSENEYRWDTNVDFALGPVRPNDLALVFAGMITAAEGKTERDVRANLASSMPRTSAALGSAFTLDSLKPIPLPDGSTSFFATFSVHADRLRQRFPNFGEYVQKYVDPARMHVSLADRSAIPFIDMQLRDRVVSVRIRSQGGRLLPLSGPPKPMPDSLVLVADVTLKVKLFNVGFHELSMDFVNSARGDVERAWSVTARKEPKWNLPFITARLIRAPLRRPFVGEGAAFRLAVRADAGEQTTVLVRQARLVVQESAILKFINSLSSTAMDDFGARVEKEESQWFRELFLALRDDARAVHP